MKKSTLIAIGGVILSIAALAFAACTYFAFSLRNVVQNVACASRYDDLD